MAHIAPARVSISHSLSPCDRCTAQRSRNRAVALDSPICWTAHQVEKLSFLHKSAERSEVCVYCFYCWRILQLYLYKNPPCFLNYFPPCFLVDGTFVALILF